VSETCAHQLNGVKTTRYARQPDKIGHYHIVEQCVSCGDRLPGNWEHGTFVPKKVVRKAGFDPDKLPLETDPGVGMAYDHVVATPKPAPPPLPPPPVLPPLSLELTAGQNQALAMVKQLMAGSLVGVLRGYAGTGKTTCLRALADAFGPPIVLTPTGKASLRVQEATGLRASTIHRWMYIAKLDPKTGEWYFVPRDSSEIERPANNLIVVDEASMLGKDIYRELMNKVEQLGCSLLLVGDKFQLPPVQPRNEEPFSVLLDSFQCDARVDLTEIVRQALDSPIIRASMALRRGDTMQVRQLLRRLKREEVMDIALDMFKKGDGTVICHKNDTRYKINDRMRACLGFKGALQVGEPLLVLHNTYDESGWAVYNGEVVSFPGWEHRVPGIHPVRKYKDSEEIGATFGTFTLSGVKVVMSEEGLTGAFERLGVPVPWVGSVSHRAINKDNTGERLKVPYLAANFGYCLTAHKSQGSEWDRVVTMVERHMRPEADTERGLEDRRWLYTAITRARKESMLYWE
jgi:exodeoxyribonuclease V